MSYEKFRDKYSPIGIIWVLFALQFIACYVTCIIILHVASTIYHQIINHFDTMFF